VTRLRLVAVRGAVGLTIVAALAWFAYANAGQTVNLRFGLFTLRSVPLMFALYGAVVVGMLVMLVAGLRSEMRAHDALKRYDKIAASTLSDFEAQESGVMSESEDKT
jgi:uncharacterized integral membrane protein